LLDGIRLAITRAAMEAADAAEAAWPNFQRPTDAAAESLRRSDV
jgi:hypothetical protein